MKLTEVLFKDCVLSDLKSQNKSDAIVEIVGIMKSLNKVQNSDEIVKALMDREALGSTGIGQGIAIPHAKTDSVDELTLMFCRSRGGVEFDSLDGGLAFVFFLILNPKNCVNQHLRIVSRVTKILKEPYVVQQLVSADGVEDIYSILEREDKKITEQESKKSSGV